MMKRTLRTAGIATMMAFVCTAALAASAGAAPVYRYIEAGYLNVDPDNFDGSGDNWYAEGSMDFLKSFHASARYVSGDYADNIDLSVWNFAVGWHGMLGEKGDIIAEATWVDQEVQNDSDSGVGVNAGVRWRFVKAFEADGIVHWTDYSDAGSQDSYEVKGIFFLGRIGIGAAATFSSDDTRYNGFVRFNFGRD